MNDFSSSLNRDLNVIREADVCQRKESHEPQTASFVTNLGGTARIPRPIFWDEIFLFIYQW